MVFIDRQGLTIKINARCRRDWTEDFRLRCTRSHNRGNGSHQGHNEWDRQRAFVVSIGVALRKGIPNQEDAGDQAGGDQSERSGALWLVLEDGPPEPKRDKGIDQADKNAKQQRQDKPRFLAAAHRCFLRSTRSTNSDFIFWDRMFSPPRN